jgi:hypothetical protein
LKVGLQSSIHGRDDSDAWWGGVELGAEGCPLPELGGANAQVVFGRMRGHVISPRRMLPVAAAVLLLGIPVVGLAPGMLEALTYLLPALMLVLVLLARRYPGERTLLGLISRRRPGPRRDRARVLAPRTRPRAILPRGGQLIASSLAVRPPPGRPGAVLS